MVRSRWLGALAGTLMCLAPAVGQMMKPASIVNIREGDGPARQCKVVKLTRTEKDGGRIWQVEALDTGEKMEVLEPRNGKGMPIPVNVPSAPISRPAAALAGTAPCAAPQSKPPQPDPAPRGLLVSWFGTSTKPAAPAACGPAVCPPATETPTPCPPGTGTSVTPPLADTAKPTVAAEVVPAKPGNWRESWGKAERWTDKGSMPTVEKARKSFPVASHDMADPLTHPELYSKVPLPSTVKPVAAPAAPPAIVQAAKVETKTAAKPTGETLLPPRTAPTQAGGWWTLSNLGFGGAKANSCPASCDAAAPKKVAVATATPRTAPMMPRGYLGSGSIAGATERIVYTPKAPTAPVAPPPNILAAPSHSDYGGASGNAFSSVTTYRPIPADQGMSPLTPGAFTPRPGVGMMPMQPQPPMPPQPLPPAIREQMMMAAMAQQQQTYAAQMAMAMQYQALVAHQVAMQQAAQNPTPKLLVALREAMLPSEREMAVERLRFVDWKAEPAALSGLTDAARGDPSPSVRVACVRALGQMRANTYPVIQTLQHLSEDRDTNVREESLAALQAIAKPRK